MDTCSAPIWEMLLAQGGRGVPAGGPSPTVGCSMSVVSTDEGDRMAVRAAKHGLQFGSDSVCES